MKSTIYTIRELSNMIAKNVKCPICHKYTPTLRNECGISVSEAGARLLETGICPDHGVQTKYSVL